MVFSLLEKNIRKRNKTSESNDIVLHLENNAVSPRELKMQNKGWEM